MGEEYAARIFGHMNDDEIKDLSQVMANLGNVSSNLVEKLLLEFAEQMTSTGGASGTLESTERLLMKVLDKSRVSNIMEDIRGPAGRTMWDKLANVNETVLAAYLKNEYPQTVAVVMTKIKPDHAARVLSELPESFAMEVISRMLRMESVQKDVIDDIERTLRNEFMSNLARTNRRDSHEMMAEIFNNLDRANESKFMNALEERNKDAADKIKGLMFTFEDLQKLDNAAMQAILRVADKGKLPTALKGSSDTIKDMVFANMSERAGKLLKDDIAALGPVRLRDVEEAQGHLVNVAKDLASKGEIVIARIRKKMNLSTEAQMTKVEPPVKKFMFERSFDDVSIAQRAVERKPVLMKPEQIDALKKEGYDAGYDAGHQAGQQDQAALLAAIMARVEQRLDAFMKTMGEIAQQQDEYTRKAVLAIARKILPAFSAKNGMEEIEAVLSETIRDMAREPRLVVRVNESEFDAINEKVQAIATQRAYSGKVIVLADAEVAAGDCRIEWADGGVERDTNATMQTIEQTITPST
jgi:flagellar motor switch protein FliG